MNYQRIYDELIAARRLAPVPEGYTETHHIIPRALQGSDDADNLIALTPEDHFMCHRLLAKIHGGKMSQALWGMCHKGFKGAKGVYVSRLVFGVARREFAKVNSERMSGSGNPMFGRTEENSPFYGKHHRAAAIAKIREARLGKKASEEVRHKMSEAKLGKSKPNETRRKMSEAKCGKNNPMYGKRHNAAVREKMSEANRNKQQYIFQHDEHGEVIATQYELRTEFGLNANNLSDVCCGRVRTHKGWRCLGIAEEAE